MSLYVDVVILGGGPAGASAAISLLQKKYTVAIIEKTGFSFVRIGETISPKVTDLFQKLGIKNKILDDHSPSYANQSTWGSSKVEENNFLYNPLGNGWHLDRLKFDSQLIEHAVKMGAYIFTNSNIKTIEQKDTENWRIKFLKTGYEKIIEAGFAIDATGRNALLARNQGGRRMNIDHLIGIVSVLDKYPKKKQTNYTLVESVKNGWWYSADLPEKKLIVTFMTDADIYKQELFRGKNSWIQNLPGAKKTLERCGNNFPHKPDIYAANSYIMTKRFGKNWLAIGDAAMSYDPLSSSGILKGMRDGIEVSDSIQQFFSGEKYASERFSDLSEERFIKYLQMRSSYYKIENRWPDSVFWKRRHFIQKETVYSTLIS